MGCCPSISRKTIKELSKESSLSPEEIKNLHVNYISALERMEDKTGLTSSSFQEALGLTAGEIMERIFRAFDLDDDKILSFREYVLGVAFFSTRLDLERRIHFAFALFDRNKDGMIDEDEVRSILKAAIEQTGKHADDRVLKNVTDEMFSAGDRNKDNLISEEEFTHLIMKNPKIIDALSVFK
ncbi:Calcineurin B protein like protein [Aduncisulcus paluster]|uniref:Calcineurin B protein like protein n=1 Tax=Aduncisulcus paluster TaxID=2918883 RepID=A0ABQ5KQZ6_9EUKA|nr:Calcineurin B protein like protein [Aduncisulcus paluster]